LARAVPSITPHSSWVLRAGGWPGAPQDSTSMIAVPREDSPQGRPRPPNRSAPDLSTAVEAGEADVRAIHTPTKPRSEADDSDDADIWLLVAAAALGNERVVVSRHAHLFRPMALGVALWVACTLAAVALLHAYRGQVDGHMPPLMIPADASTLVATAILLSLSLVPWAVMAWRMLRCRLWRWSWGDAVIIVFLWSSSSFGGFCMLSTRDKPPSSWRVAATTVFGLTTLSLVVLPVVRCCMVLARAATRKTSWRWEPRVARMVLAATAGSALWAGFRPVAVVDVELYVSGLPLGLDGYVLCAISDLHAGPAVGAEVMHVIVEKIRSLGCKALLLNGDIAEGSVEQRGSLMEELAAIVGAMPDGAYFVPGNHEFYNFAAPGGGQANAAAWTSFWAAHGVRSLNNSHVRLPVKGPEQFVLAGVDDLLGFPHLEAALPDANVVGIPTVLAAHRPFPFVDDAARRGVAAQLSGHTHGGQMWPVHLPAALAARGYLSGMYTVRNTVLYVSDGTVGTYQTRLRLLTHAEITKAILRSHPCPRPGWREADVGLSLSYASAALCLLALFISLGRCARGLRSEAVSGRQPQQHLDAEGP